MAKVRMELLLALVLVMTSAMVDGAKVTPFPTDCSSYVSEGRAVPLKFCCIAVQDEFLLKSGGIKSYCKAVKHFEGNQLVLALSVPAKCNLNGYYKKGSTCAGTFACLLLTMFQVRHSQCLTSWSFLRR